MSSLALKIRNRARRQLFAELGSAISAGDAARAMKAVSSRGRFLGLPVQARQELSQIIAGRLDDALSHTDATTALHTLADSLPHTLPTDTLLTLENIARSIGCFHASHHFTTLAHHHIHHTPHPPETRFLAHLHHKNLTGAIDTYNSVTHHTTLFWTDASHYLWLWSGGTAGTPHHTNDTPWTTTLTGHHITILGPAPTTHTPPPTTHHLVARVIVPGVMSWSEDSGPFGSVCDLAYANSRSTKWFIENEPAEAFRGFQVVSFRTEKWRQLGLSNGRTARNHSAFLMLSTDKTNMIPLMMWDVLGVPEVTVTIAGTTFFASANSYTPDNLRFTHSDAGTADARGSAGGLFERCLSFSHHGLTDHHSFVANLVDAGVVDIDQAGRDVLSMSTEEYLTTLDKLYGVDRV